MKTLVLADQILFVYTTGDKLDLAIGNYYYKKLIDRSLRNRFSCIVSDTLFLNIQNFGTNYQVLPFCFSKNCRGGISLIFLNTLLKVVTFLNPVSYATDEILLNFLSDILLHASLILISLRKLMYVLLVCFLKYLQKAGTVR